MPSPVLTDSDIFLSFPDTNRFAAIDGFRSVAQSDYTAARLDEIDPVPAGIERRMSVWMPKSPDTATNLGCVGGPIMRLAAIWIDSGGRGEEVAVAQGRSASLRGSSAGPSRYSASPDLRVGM